MKKIIYALVFLVAGTTAKSHAQEKDFEAFAEKEDKLIQAAYYKKDVPELQKNLNTFLEAYQQLNEKDKEQYKDYLDGNYYNASCTYALLGDKNTALDYLEKSEYYNYQHLLEDHDLDTIRNDARFRKFLEIARKKGDLYKASAFKTPYKPNLSDEEKIAGLSQLWAQARSNFVYFDHVDIDWNKSYLEYLEKIKATHSTKEYYKVLQLFYAQLKDGHTGVFPPRDLRKEMYSRPPLFTEMVEGRVFIKEVISEGLKKDGIVPGLEVLKIDSEPVIAYAEKNIIPYESSSTPQDMEVRAYTYSLLTGPDQPVVLELKDAKGKVFTKSIARSGYHDLKYDKSWSPLYYEQKGDFGYLVINSFSDESIEKQFDLLFDSISRTKGLIIDIRNNGGGSSNIGYYIIQKLTDKPFKTSACKRLKYVSIPEEKTGWEIITAGEVQPDGTKYYDKPVVVLTGPATFSAAEDFTVAFDYMKRGKIVGQPTGGSTGQPVSFDLPGGGSARICGKRDTYPDGKEFVGIGIQPDIVVKPTVKDLLAGRDAALEKAMEVLSGK